jgi:glycosyltransferase involved in cell wall biosynthesis
MRILFFGAHFPRPNNPTIGTWALSQVTALRDAGNEVKVISPVAAIPAFVSKILRRGTSALCPPRHGWNGIETEYIRWPVFPVGPMAKWLKQWPGLFVNAAWRLSSRRFLHSAARFEPDVVFAHHGQLSGFIAAKVARQFKIPFFVTEHNFADIESCATNLKRKRHYRATIQGISRWIAVAERMRIDMNEVFPDAPAITVHNGAEQIPEEVRATPRPAELAGREVVLCATFFYPRKNVPLLIRSFDRIADKHPNALLLVIGGGDDEKGVTAAAQAATHRSRIILLGALPHAKVLQYMVWCDVFAHIGVDEPFGTVFSEAMMAGKPIIYCTDGGVTDVVVDGCHGLGVEPGSARSAEMALERLLSDSALRSRLGSAAGALANTQLTWQRNAKDMSALFAAAVRAAKPGESSNRIAVFPGPSQLPDHD